MGGQAGNSAKIVSPEAALDLGRYVITEEALVDDGPTFDSQEVAVLNAGAAVEVLEIVEMPEIRRVRARIENPKGWISLVDMDDGFRWAEARLSVHATLYN